VLSVSEFAQGYLWHKFMDKAAVPGDDDQQLPMCGVEDAGLPYRAQLCDFQAPHKLKGCGASVTNFQLARRLVAKSLDWEVANMQVECLDGETVRVVAVRQWLGTVAEEVKKIEMQNEDIDEMTQAFKKLGEPTWVPSKRVVGKSGPTPSNSGAASSSSSRSTTAEQTREAIERAFAELVEDAPESLLVQFLE
jgi:hypothetical protein